MVEVTQSERELLMQSLNRQVPVQTPENNTKQSPVTDTVNHGGVNGKALDEFCSKEFLNDAILHRAKTLNEEIINRSKDVKTIAEKINLKLDKFNPYKRGFF